MIVGVVKEIKDSENRVALTPAGAEALTSAGHTVLVQASAGAGTGTLLGGAATVSPGGSAVGQSEGAAGRGAQPQRVAVAIGREQGQVEQPSLRGVEPVGVPQAGQAIEAAQEVRVERGGPAEPGD
jgi:hypothetical protein